MSAPGEDLFAKVEALVERLERLPDPSARDAARELMRVTLELHGQGLQRLMQLSRAHGDEGRALLREMGRDDLLSSLLALHGLHPEDLFARVEAGLEKTRTYLKLSGFKVELSRVHEGCAYLRLIQVDGGSKTPVEKIREAIDRALAESAPDLETVSVEQLALQQNGFVQLRVEGRP